MSENFRPPRINDDLLDRLFGTEEDLEAASLRERQKRELSEKWARINSQYPGGQSVQTLSTDCMMEMSSTDNGIAERYESD